MDLNIRLEVFEGPLDLLLHLLEKNKVSISDIPIVEITDQYMEYIRQMPRQDLDSMSEFLLMAATLLDIKSRWLLPAGENEDGEEEDPRQELAEQLWQYKVFKYLSQELKDRQVGAGRRMYRAPAIPEEVSRYEEPVDLEEMTRGIDLARLNDIFRSVIRRQRDKVDPIRSEFGKIEKDEISLEKKMDFLDHYCREHRQFSFRSLLERQNSRMELVVTFLAVLELMKMGKLTALQDHLFGEIVLSVRSV